MMRWEKVRVNARARETPEGKRVAGRKGGVWGPGKRWGHTCNAIRDGRLLYVFGGYGEDCSQTNDVHVFDTVKRTWSKPMMKGAPPSPRDSHTCTAVGNRLFVFGGTDGKNPLNDLYVLDTSSNTWLLPITQGKGPDAREGHGAALVGKRLFIFGGCGKSESKSEEVYYDDLYILDTENLVWELGVTSGTLPSARDSHTLTSWGNQIIVLGGEDASDCYLSDVYLLDTDTMVWKELSTSGQTLTQRAGHTTVAMGRNLFVFGGFADRRNLYNDLHVLNIDTGIWNSMTNLNQGPSARFSAAGDCVDQVTGTLVLIGGCDGDLEALDDMYYLHTDMHTGNGKVDGKREKLSFRRELKRKCQESRYENDSNVHTIGMASDSSQTGRFLYNLNPAEGKTFEARVVDRIRDGYTVETSINGQLLRGVLLLCNPNSNNGRHQHINKNKKRMGMDSDARSSDEYQWRLETANATPLARQSAHEGVNGQDQTKALTTVPSHGETLGPYVMTMVPADVAAQPERGLERDPSSLQELHLSDECYDSPNGPTREGACGNPAATEDILSKLPTNEPSSEGNGNLINVQ